MPVRFGLMGIDAAWVRSQGAGVVVGVMDSGLSSAQAEMNGHFAMGSSAGRTRVTHSTLGSAYSDRPAWDGPCSHGPRMASLITAPRNGTSTVGVAYRSDLVAVRFTDGVVDVDAWHAAAAIDFYISQVQQNHRRVIAMAWRSAPSGYLSDVIDARYHSVNGVLFVGAVGQSFCLNPFRGVAWPARKAEVVAVGGVEDNNELPCMVHRGPETEVVGLKEFPIPGYATGDPLGAIRETSSATAAVSGIAALVWARYPSWSRDQVRARLQQAGSYWPARDDRRGYGIVDAHKAVGGFASVKISVPLWVEPYSVVNATAVPTGDGPFTYQWSNGATTLTVDGAGYYDLSVTVTDSFENRQRTAVTTITAGDPGGCGTLLVC